MTAAAPTPEQRLADHGLQLPEVPTPAAAYVPWRRVDDLVFTAGQLPVTGGKLPTTGKLGDSLTTDQGVELARTAALNLLAVAAQAAGGLSGVRTVRLTVFVASAPGFTEQHRVADGASGLLADVLADEGAHARSAVGVAALPLDSPVEVDGVFAVG